MKFDIVDDNYRMDILSPLGFLHAVKFALKLRRGAQCVLAPVCSSWVWLNRGTSGRSELTPLGNETVPSVRFANLVVSRVALLLYILSSKCVFWILEQPVSSLMEHYPRFQDFARRNQVFKHYIEMQNYGAPTMKPTWLCSNMPFINDIDMFKEERTTSLLALVSKTTDVHGCVRVSGNNNLKQSLHGRLLFLFFAPEDHFRNHAFLKGEGRGRE